MFEANLDKCSHNSNSTDKGASETDKEMQECNKKSKCTFNCLIPKIQRELLDRESEDESFESEDFLSSQGSIYLGANANARSSSIKINRFVSDEEFKANYSPVILQKQTTLVLKTSFHLINYILMGLCQVFLNIKENKKTYQNLNEVKEEIIFEKK